MLVLKRLSDAERDGDPILAIIRGSAVNQDGRSNGLTAPNGPSQEMVIQRALDDAGVGPTDIDYVEGHGTGTPLGDPIEVKALGTVFSARNSGAPPLMIGSVKSNIGHTQSAAGAAGIMKVVLAMQHGVIPPSLHFHDPNPRIEWSSYPLQVVTEAVPWVAKNKPRRAGVSSFGISGTNAHVILEEAPPVASPLAAKEENAYLLPLSAKTPEALTALARDYAQWFVSEHNLSLPDAIFTATRRRTHHEYRVAAVARTAAEFASVLNAFAQGQADSGSVQGRISSAGLARVVFVFPGQGSQWLGMGRQLLAEEAVFREAIQACDQKIQHEAGFSVLAEITASETESHMSNIDVVQPVLFAMEVALAALWQSWGVAPDCVIGHSMGEVAAAHIAGLLSLEDAVNVICRRSRLLKRISGQGAMALVELPIAEAELAIGAYNSQLATAVSNGPRSTVLSGAPEALEAVLTALEAKGVFCRRVKVDVASHSPQVDPLKADLLDELCQIKPQASQLPMRSTVTCQPLQGPEVDATYWWNNLRQPVRFSDVVQGLLEDGHTIFVELSPHPILLPSIAENLRTLGIEGACIASLRRQTNESLTMLEALGSLYVHGCTIHWERRLPERGRVVALPTYPWQRQRYWIDPPKLRRDDTPQNDTGSKVAEEAVLNDEFGDCIFEIVWRRAEIQTSSSRRLEKTDHWLILVDERGMGATLAKHLRTQGARVTEVSVQSEYSRLGDDAYGLDPTNSTHWEKVVTNSLGKQGWNGVIHCAALDGASWAQTTTTTISTDLRRGPLATLRLLQSIVKQGWRDAPRFYVLTRGAQAVGSSPNGLSVAQSTIWGMGRVMSMEQPDVGCTRIDLPAENNPDEIEFILRELAENGPDDQIALRADGRYVARLERGSWSSDIVKLENTRIHDDRTYLITGGLGGLGLSLAKWMVERGARHFMLLGRKAPNEIARTVISDLEAMGAEVHTLQADVARRADV
ncbi:MAG TPA: SDR family NAD(P)-dependent oxidoreductase, partial [Polyangium sp.]|nr:SDR family NAD(P)-dependent oxidoreductase [Polyangium sp.]